MEGRDSVKEAPPDMDELEEENVESQRNSRTVILDVPSFDNDDDSTAEQNSTTDEIADNNDVDPLAFKCKQCKKHFNSSELLLKHQLIEHRGNSHTCKLCRRVFFDKNDLSEHEAKHKTGKHRLYKCSMCPRHFFNDRLLAEHETKHEQSGAIFFKKRMTGPRTNHSFKVRCDACRVDFMSNLRFRKHLQRARCDATANQWTYFCIVCQSMVERAVKESQTHYCRPRFTCHECSQTLTSKNRLINHIKKSHPKASAVVGPDVNYCLQCDKHFPSTEEYDEHNLQSKHNVLNLISCKICSSMFTNQTNLRKHEERHETYLASCKYVCRYCQARFKQPRKLLGHYAGTHSKERPYKCEQCIVDFQTKNKFAAHIRSEHKGNGKIKFLKDFSIIFTPNPVSQSAADLDNAEILEPVEVGATETVETSEDVNNDVSNVQQNQSLNVTPSSSSQQPQKIIIGPSLKNYGSIAKEIKLKLNKKLEISQKVIIKKISEDEAKEKKQMVFNAVPIANARVETNDINTYSDEPSIHYDVAESPNICDDFSNDGGNYDFTTYNNEEIETTVPVIKEPLLLVNSNPLENLIKKQLLEEDIVRSQESGSQTKGPQKSIISVIINTLMATAATKHNIKTPKAKPRQPREFDYLSIIKNSLAVDEEAAKQKDIVKKTKEKKVPKPKYTPKQYDYLSIISQSLKEDAEAAAKKQAKAKKVLKNVKEKKAKIVKPKYQPKEYDVKTIISNTLKLDEEAAEETTKPRGRPKSKTKTKTTRKRKAKSKQARAKKLKMDM